ncbi:MAG: glycoside hydrolase family 88 protein [Tidjanibacter sp.]|nr:glycoside hydrolase family 88 protein [Tidjanibacter sp.]
MKKLVIIALALCSLVSTACVGTQRKEKSMEQITKEVMAVAAEHCKNMDATLPEGRCPRTFERNRFVHTDIYWWCSGFYPGSMWYIYEYTKDEQIKALAEKHTLKLDPLQWVTTDHDVGFQLFSSYGNGYRLTGNEDFVPVLRNGAKSLASRFNPVIGSLRSWDFKKNLWDFPVIIDNMMNLELIMWVANLDGDEHLRHVATTHANTTMKNHFRSDYSTYHLVDYNPKDGSINKKQTVQGFADESRWARGQAWALYGFTMMHRMTGEQAYLERAQKVAEMILPYLPEDGIPYWDFNSHDIPNDLQDASAGAIMASALIELSGYVPERSEAYLAVAERQLRTLASDEYLAQPGTNNNFILRHGVGHKPSGGEVDAPLTYADYYFLEALIRWQALGQN